MKTPESDLLGLTPRIEVSRRDALKLLAAGIAALEVGCLVEAGQQQIVPYLVDPPEQRPGVPVRYTSAFAIDGFGTGLIVETHEGRPTKVDGNPAHPANLGGSTPYMQGRILDLYDPQRSREASLHGVGTSWDEIVGALRSLPQGPLWLVMPPQSSPTLAGLLARVRAQHDLHVVYDTPVDHRSAYRGHALVYGRPLEQQLDLSRADVIVSLDSDFMAALPMSPAWARAASARRVPNRRMNRIWLCEPMQTPTGTIADERLALPASDVVAIAACVIEELGARGLGVPTLPGPLLAQAHQRLGGAIAWTRRLADDLASHRGAGAVIVGDRQPPVVHALARWIDTACGNVGGPVTLSEPALFDPLGPTLTDLASAFRTHAVASVVLIDTDPVYTAPASLGLRDLLRTAPFSLHVGLYRNETSDTCKAQMPLAHELETWTDPRAYDGTLAIGQPMIRPRFEVASAIDVLAAILNDPRDSRTLVRDQFRDIAAPGVSLTDVEPTWASALRAGVVPNTKLASLTPAVTWPNEANAELARAMQPIDPHAIEIALTPSQQVYDGRFAPNAWLQELPHPITKQTWGNAALMSEATAASLGVGNQDLVRITTTSGAIEIPALIVTGAADRSITIELGYGQLVPATPIADRVGSNAYVLRDEARLILAGAAAAAHGTRRIVRTQHTTGQEGREIAPMMTLAGFLAKPDFTANLRGEQVSLLPAQPRDGVQWGMSIDTSICTGCSSCMVACQAENNIPTVGPDDVARGRHMNWIRVDRYIVEGGAVVNEPMPCQHCENAPCEYVCPVNATTHSPDGLNEQVYNRCIGTRFCSNNCPYKVRRFNWFSYEKTSSEALQYNPDVTVRSRGVMEKCTYCVQRIRRAEHAALVEHRAIRAGEVVTACQQACPTGAIQFGELHEKDTLFARLRRDPRRFEALYELGTRPRTEYLAKIRNPKAGT
ncbi:MAG: putative oxidoreductase, iron-sulfur binding protein [Myxococcales bacterium]|nr:putative oxidoreductase, iron-sulfur binding protein [Myxococcales bacterium]